MELLVVVGIIAILIALLMPVVSSVRKSARSAKCLAHLQQWGQAFQMYLSAHHGRQPLEYSPNDPASREWWESLAPYTGDAKGLLLCPEADEPRDGPPDRGYTNYKEGRSSHAWWAEKRGTWHGSYGFNAHLCQLRNPPTPPHPLYFRFPVREADRIPVLGDCCEPRATPDTDNKVPSDLHHPAPGQDGGVAEYCIDRHGMAVNLVFLDGHAERVPLKRLWTLKWSASSVPRDVVVPRR